MPSTVYLFIYIKLNEYFGGISFFIFFFSSHKCLIYSWFQVKCALAKQPGS